jgi:riboflavin kinase/FMN adenylyltransferase
LAGLDGEQFFGGLLADRVPLAAIHVGENFGFGKGRRGNGALLREIGARRGFEVHEVPPVEIDGRTISSTAVRAALALGDVASARRMLGRSHVVAGEVVRGDGRGRELHCPTANLELENEVLPKNGVYVTETMVLASRFPSVTNIGVRPTFGGKTVKVESHLLGYQADLYHERMEVHFFERLRDEMQFEGPTALADQLARDRAAATSYFENQPLGAS